MPDSEDQAVNPNAQDIVFECPHCGKSLAIDYHGAGLTIQCPDCTNDVQVPIPEGVKLEDIDSEITAAAPESPADTESSEQKIKELMTELEELRFRRRYLEKKHAEKSRWIRTLSDQLQVIRAALDQMEDFLKQQAAAAAEDTQQLG